MLLMCKNTPVYELDPDDFDEQTIIELFGKAGAQMLIIDAVIGNGDRHAVKFCMPYKDEIRRIVGVAAEAENEVFKKRAQSILKLIE